MANKPLQIGLTGGIGAGKSLIGKIFQLLGIPVYDADSRSKWIASNHPDVVVQVIKLMGKEAYKEGELNRTYLAELIFNDELLSKSLTDILHPKVKEDFDVWVAAHANNPYVLKEAALLYESGSWEWLDKILVVTAPVEVRVKRVLARDIFRTEADIKKIMNNQLPEGEKVTRADFIITNDDRSSVIQQVLAIHEQLLLQALR